MEKLNIYLKLADPTDVVPSKFQKFVSWGFFCDNLLEIYVNDRDHGYSFYGRLGTMWFCLKSEFLWTKWFIFFKYIWNNMKLRPRLVDFYCNVVKGLLWT